MTLQKKNSLGLCNFTLSIIALMFKKKLGGFTSMTQLHEIYNMTEDIYQILVDNAKISIGEVVKIKINSATKANPIVATKTIMNASIFRIP